VAIAAYSLARVGADPNSVLAPLEERSEPGMAKIFARFREEPVEKLSTWGYREVPTSLGVVLVDDDTRPYEPTRPLMHIAVRIIQLLENDRWRVGHIAAGSSLPPVWLRRGARTDTERALRDVRACIALGATPQQSDVASDNQMLHVFVCESTDSRDAAIIATTAGPGEESNFAVLALSHDVVSVVLINRSVMLDGRPSEDDRSLERFRPGLEEALELFSGRPLARGTDSDSRGSP
jgi:hypothetical protein